MDAHHGGVAAVDAVEVERREGCRLRRCRGRVARAGDGAPLRVEHQSLAALMTESCGSGCRSEGADDEPLGRHCCLSPAIHSTGSEYPCAWPTLPSKRGAARAAGLGTIFRSAGNSVARTTARTGLRDARSFATEISQWVAQICRGITRPEAPCTTRPALEIAPGTCTVTDDRRDAVCGRARIVQGHTFTLRIWCCRLRRAATRTRFLTRCRFDPGLTAA